MKRKNLERVGEIIKDLKNAYDDLDKMDSWANQGDLVLDNAASSMTTAIACINTSRRCICIEKDDGFFEMGEARVKSWLDIFQKNM